MFYLYLIIAICSYLYGSIPFGYIFTKLFTGKRVYEYATKTIGVANTFTVGGKKAGYLTVLGEASKGVLPVIIFPALFQSPSPMLVSIFFALIGTSFPVFLPGQYSKGRTLIGWGTFFMSFYTTITIGILWTLSAIVFKKARLSFFLSSLSYPFLLYLFQQHLSYLIFGFGVIGIFFIRSNSHNDDFKKNRIFEKWQDYFEKHKKGKGRNHV